VNYLAYCGDEAGSFETQVNIYQAKRRQIPEDYFANWTPWEYLKTLLSDYRREVWKQAATSVLTHFT